MNDMKEKNLGRRKKRMVRSIRDTLPDTGLGCARTELAFIKGGAEMGIPRLPHFMLCLSYHSPEDQQVPEVLLYLFHEYLMVRHDISL